MRERRSLSLWGRWGSVVGWSSVVVLRERYECGKRLEVGWVVGERGKAVGPPSERRGLRFA